MKDVNAIAVGSFTDETTASRRRSPVPMPSTYKGITLSPAGSFLAAETVWRQGATGGDINTAFTGVPLQNSAGSAIERVLRFGPSVARRLQGRRQNLQHATLTGYYEADWLSSGTTSNNNQSNSYTLRQRQICGPMPRRRAAGTSPAAQGWSLVAETTSGLTRGTEILPSTIDAQYAAGFVWARQYSFRVSKDFGKKVLPRRLG